MRLLSLVGIAMAAVLGGAQAENAAFDLAGPSLRITVTHDDVTLPLSQVPNLSAGDRLRIAAVLPADQAARYRLVLAFLRGATNPPPKKWLSEVRTWKPEEATLAAVVPEGAQQAIMFLVPDTGGAFDAVSAAVRQRPGAFVRASQDLNQAMLDRTRLETFLRHARQRPAAEAARLTPILAESLAVKIDTACLRQQDPQAACLTQGQNAAVLADGQTSSIAQTLAGAPANIALQLSATPQAGYGYYSAYIGVFRDLARMLGAFQSAQLQFIPALNVQREALTELLLNTIPSFRKPQSVLVAALPPVTAPALPPLRAEAATSLCLARPGLVLPVEGAPLLFSTGYPRQMVLRVPGASGTLELPVSPDPTKGGLVLATAPGLLRGAASELEGTLHGRWGFAPFDGPRFRLMMPGARVWQTGDATLVVGRETPLTLSGGAAPCVQDILLDHPGGQRPVAWQVTGDGRLDLKVPLVGSRPGPVTLLIRSFGSAEPQRLPLRTYAEVSRLDGFAIHAGDSKGVLTGARLDQIASLEWQGISFRPAGLDRVGTTDRLTMVTDGAAPPEAGTTTPARAVLADGRTVKLDVRITSPRPVARLVSTSVVRVDPGPSIPLKLVGEAFVALDTRVTFSLRAEGTTRFDADLRVEVGTDAAGGTARLPVQLQDDRVALTTFDPSRALGSSAHGALRFRVVQGGAEGDWQPLATLVRLPRLSALACADGATTCVLRGEGLYLVARITAAPAGQADVVVPDGFTGSTITVPRPSAAGLTLHLRDAPGASAILAQPPAGFSGDSGDETSKARP